MAKILVKGPRPEDMVAVTTCHECQSLVEFDKTDVRAAGAYSYVDCPACDTSISEIVLRWSDRRQHPRGSR